MVIRQPRRWRGALHAKRTFATDAGMIGRGDYQQL